MTSRFTSNVIALVVGGFMVALSLGLGLRAVGWLGLAMGCVVVATTLVAFAFSGRGKAQRVIDVLVLAVGAWTIVASRTFDGSTLKWLTFSEGILLALLALEALVVHEVLLELAVRRVTQETAEVRASGCRLPVDEGVQLGLARQAP